MVSQTGAKKLTAMTCSTSSALVRAAFLWMLMPALFTRMSTRPNVASVALTPRVLGHIAAALYVLCGGLVALVGPLLPSMQGTNRVGLAVLGAIAAAIGAVVWRLPWDRWNRSATLWLVPVSFALIGLHNH